MGYSKSRNLKFINPYTFVPIQKDLSQKRKDLKEIQEEELHTGILKCRLRVITPLGIPDAEKASNQNGHITYPFYSYEASGKKILAIPGSSLRGAIRSVFEAVTDSCFTTLREGTVLSRRVNIDARERSYQPGILKQENGRWRLYRAKRYLMATHMPQRYGRSLQNACVTIEVKDGIRTAKTYEGLELRFGDIVEFSLCKDNSGNVLCNKKGNFVIWEGIARDIAKTDSMTRKNSGKEIGVAFIGEPFSRKKGESIFVCLDEEVKFSKEEMEEAYAGLEKTLEEYQDKAINKKLEKDHWGYASFKYAEKNKLIPIWYSEEDKKLSLAAIGRTVYKTSLNELAGTHKPCTSRDGLCEACALFGMVQQENLGSRIRVTDAAINKNSGTSEVTLRVLGQPRPSYLPFYVRSSDDEKDITGGKRMPGYDDDVEIAGRKFYWHNPAAASHSRIYQDSKKEPTNNTVELVLPGAEFVFDIYYDGITQEQLEKLMWCIHFGENRMNSTLAHKIGRGKSLGLGSTKIVIEKQMERIFKDGKYTWEIGVPADSDSELMLENKEEILKIANVLTLKDGSNKNVPVRYPYIQGAEGISYRKNDLAGHQWFSSYKKDREEMGRLPYITEEDQTLPVYVYNGRRQNTDNKKKNYRRKQ